MNYDKIYINGQWVKPNSEKWIEVINPATKEVIERVVRSNEKDTNLAIKAAIYRCFRKNSLYGKGKRPFD